MKKLLFATAALATMLGTACTDTKSGAQYQVIITGAAPDGALAYLVDYDNGDKTDSVMVRNDSVVFSGVVDKPYLARVIVDGNRAGMLIVEGGRIERDSTKAYVGTKLNADLNHVDSLLTALQQQADSLPKDSLGIAKLDSLSNVMIATMQEAVKQHPDDPVGYYYFLQQAYMMDKDELEDALNEYPQMRQYTRVQNLIKSLEAKASTSVGQKYKDFEIPTDSVAVTLSQYINADSTKYTLVDFWASWCGPCRREIPVIKSILEAHSDSLQVVGVAVWDKPEDTRAAVEQMSITWPVIYDAQTIPTDIYGIPGIPCIIVIDPNGVIVSRDQQGDQLKAEVDSILAAAPRAAALKAQE